MAALLKQESPGFSRGECQDAVWDLTRQIPAGRVATYGQLAAMLGNPLASRAVGYALRALQPGSDVPWQRVVNKAGGISPRGGDDPGGPCIQRARLTHEGVTFRPDGTINLREHLWEGPPAAF